MTQITATVNSQPITASVSGSGVIAANVGSSTVSSNAGGGIGPQGIPGVAGAKGDTGSQGPAGNAASATTSASDLTSGTLADARLSANVVLTGDSRLTDSRTPTSHVHGNLTNAGAIGSTTGQVVVTTTSGVLTTAATISASTQVSGLATVATSGSAADLSGTLADARLSSTVTTALTNARTPTSHASSHSSGGADALTLAASQITSGTIADARLSANVPLLPGMMFAWGQSSSFVETVFRPQLAFSGLTLTSGAVTFSFFTPLFSLSVSQIAMNCGSTAASGLTLARMGLYTFDESTATLVAQTASDTTLFTTTRTQYARSFSTAGGGGFPSSYTLQAGVRYGVGVICVGTTMPLIWGATPPFEVLTLTPRLSAVRTSQSDLGTVSSFGTSSSILYARLS